MRAQRLDFPGANGNSLAARLDAPDGPARAYALFAHCFTCGKDVFAASRIAQALTDHGIAVLRFDFTGLGASEGEFANTTFSSNVEDLLAAASYLREQFAAPRLLIGHSLGGAATLAVAGLVPEAQAVVTISRSLGTAIIAEGVEDADQAWMLQSLGCDLAQGYHFGRPMPAADFRRKIEEASRSRVA